MWIEGKTLYADSWASRPDRPHRMLICFMGAGQLYISPLTKFLPFPTPWPYFFLEYQPFKYLLHFCNMLRCLVVENKNYAYSFLAEQQQFYRKKGKNLCNFIIFLLSSCLSFILNICSNSQKSSFKKKILSMIQKKYESCVKRSLMLQVSDNIWFPLLSTPCVCPVYFYFVSFYFISFYFILF